MANSNAVYDSDFGWVVITDPKSGSFRSASSDEVGSASNTALQFAIQQQVSPYMYGAGNTDELTTGATDRIRQAQQILAARGAGSVLSDDQILSAVNGSRAAIQAEQNTVRDLVSSGQLDPYSQRAIQQGGYYDATKPYYGQLTGAAGSASVAPSPSPSPSPAPASNQNLVSSVAQLYRDTFGRDADTAGLQWWQQQAASGKYADLASLQAAFLGGIRGDDISAYADGAKYNGAWNSGLDANSQDLYYDASKDSWFMRQRQQQPQQPQQPIGGGVVNPNNPVLGGGGQQGPVNGGINIGGGVVGGGLVDYGPSINNGNVGGLGNTGVVYGPDGKPYSSVAAAIASGVTNYSFTRPNAGGNGLIKGADNLVNIPNAATGNANPGALIANQNQQLFQRPTGVQLPPGVYNPFAV